MIDINAVSIWKFISILKCGSEVGMIFLVMFILSICGIFQIRGIIKELWKEVKE